MHPAFGHDNKDRLKKLPIALASMAEDGVADGIRTRNNKLHKLGLYH